jgi:hypothetical protein
MNRNIIKGALYQSGQIRELASSMDGTAKQVSNI